MFNNESVRSFVVAPHHYQSLMVNSARHTVYCARLMLAEEGLAESAKLMAIDCELPRFNDIPLGLMIDTLLYGHPRAAVTSNGSVLGTVAVVNLDEGEAPGNGTYHLNVLALVSSNYCLPRFGGEMILCSMPMSARPEDLRDFVTASLQCPTGIMNDDSRMANSLVEAPEAMKFIRFSGVLAETANGAWLRTVWANKVTRLEPIEVVPVVLATATPAAC